MLSYYSPFKYDNTILVSVYRQNYIIDLYRKAIAVRIGIMSCVAAIYLSAAKR